MNVGTKHIWSIIEALSPFKLAFVLLEVNLSVLFRSLTDTAFDGNYDTVYIYPEDFEKSVILSWLICPSQVPVKNL